MGIAIATGLTTVGTNIIMVKISQIGLAILLSNLRVQCPAINN